MRYATSLLVFTAVMALTSGVFGPLLADRTYAFRDGAHFYPPVWRLIAAEWRAGRVPLWNPYENLGQPLLASPPAAVCYPGQLLFLIPLPLLETQKLYLVGHVLLAVATAYLLARTLGASSMAAGVGALAYSFSGNVLMQHTNAPFLVGAAWLPLAVLCVQRVVRLAFGTPGWPCMGRNERSRKGTLSGGGNRAGNAATHCCGPTCPGTNSRSVSVRWTVGLGATLALMVLGGDPQMAYNVGWIAALYAAAVLVAHVRRHGSEAGKGDSAWRRVPWASCRRAGCLLGSAGAVALVLAAVQVLPSSQFAARSNRLPPSWGDRLQARLEPRSHHEHAYHFSVAPWRLAEFAWPNVSGRQYPVHRRWLDVIPAEGRVWTPTLYMGMLPLVLGLAALRFRRGPLTQRWLSWLALLSTIAGFGYYGLGWILLECGVDTGLGGPFGGLYWLMNLLLPGYVRFRYPAKLLVITALAMSLLAARGWDRAFAGRGRGARSLLVWLGAASCAGLIGAFAVRPFWSDWMAAVPADFLFGPLDAAGAWRDLASGFAQTALLCATFGCLLHLHGRAIHGRAGRLIRHAVPRLALLLVAADLGWSNAWMMASAPSEAARSESRFGRRIAEAPGERLQSDGPASPRIWRHPIWLPAEWRESSSADRLAEAMRFDRDTVWPNYNFDFEIGVVEVQGTMMLRDYAGFLAARRSVAAEGPATVFDLASYAVLPLAKPMPRPWQAIDRVPGAVLWRNVRPLPRAWIAGTESTDRPRNLQGESCRVVHFDPQRVEIEATLREPGLVVLAEQFYPGWRLEVSRAGEGMREMPLQRAVGVMRAAELPAGRYRLTFLFRPWIVWVGAAISAAGWLALAVWIGAGWCRRWAGETADRGIRRA